MIRFAMVCLVPILFSACFADVKPWEKETLAKESMAEAGTNEGLNAFTEHIYFSKENSKGGSGVSGGGCGCN